MILSNDVELFVTKINEMYFCRKACLTTLFTVSSTNFYVGGIGVEGKPWLAWMEPAFSQRFAELAYKVSDARGSAFVGKQKEIMKKLKAELTVDQFMVVLELEGLLNDQNATEKEWMYQIGVKDGMKIWRHFENTIINED